eukprot:TRINITY_DN162_c1_g1_i2.p1 TRINITY_DN162_c1_g1~~TRINITY_DN162_c1_g1_i2.p1  ORF type:complete len:535 (+),score=79.94 TRINITY_DN162_c1_g1_i2:69-1673(+)
MSSLPSRSSRARHGRGRGSGVHLHPAQSPPAGAQPPPPPPPASPPARRNPERARRPMRLWRPDELRHAAAQALLEMLATGSEILWQQATVRARDCLHLLLQRRPGDVQRIARLLLCLLREHRNRENSVNYPAGPGDRAGPPEERMWNFIACLPARVCPDMNAWADEFAALLPQMSFLRERVISALRRSRDAAMLGQAIIQAYRRRRRVSGYSSDSSLTSSASARSDVSPTPGQAGGDAAVSAPRASDDHGCAADGGHQHGAVSSANSVAQESASGCRAEPAAALEPQRPLQPGDYVNVADAGAADAELRELQRTKWIGQVVSASGDSALVTFPKLLDLPDARGRKRSFGDCSLRCPLAVLRLVVPASSPEPQPAPPAVTPPGPPDEPAPRPAAAADGAEQQPPRWTRGRLPGGMPRPGELVRLVAAPSKGLRKLRGQIGEVRRLDGESVEVHFASLVGKAERGTGRMDGIRVCELAGLEPLGDQAAERQPAFGNPAQKRAADAAGADRSLKRLRSGSPAPPRRHGGHRRPQLEI